MLTVVPCDQAHSSALRLIARIPSTTEPRISKGTVYFGDMMGDSSASPQPEANDEREAAIIIAELQVGIYASPYLLFERQPIGNDGTDGLASLLVLV